MDNTTSDKLSQENDSSECFFIQEERQSHLIKIIKRTKYNWAADTDAVLIVDMRHLNLPSVS